MAKYIMVVYDFYNIVLGHPQKSIKAELVPFCKENLEYDDRASYEENMQRFVLDCIENQVVFVDGGAYIPVHNIHGFYPSKDNQEKKLLVEVSNKNNNQQNQQNQGNRKFNKHKKIKHNHHHQSQKAAASTTLSFEVEKTEKPIEPSCENKEGPFGPNDGGYPQ